MFRCNCCAADARREKRVEAVSDEVLQDTSDTPAVSPLRVLNPALDPAIKYSQLKQKPMMFARQDSNLDDALVAMNPSPATSEAKEQLSKEKVAALSWQRKGDNAFEKLKFEEALKAYNTAIENDPQSAVAHAGVGGVLLRQGNAEEALRALDTALNIDEVNLFALRDRAEARLKTGDIEGSIKDYNKKLELAPADGRALCGRGQAHMKLNDREKAIADFRFASQLGYKGAAALLRLANGDAKPTKADQAGAWKKNLKENGWKNLQLN